MGLTVSVEITVETFDGQEVIAQALRRETTFNADTSKILDEVPLALGAAREEFEAAASKIERRLTDWATTIQKAIEASIEADRAAAEEARRRRESEEPGG